MIKRYNRLSFVFFLPGLVLQVVGLFMSEENNDLRGTIGLALMAVGTILAFTGLAYYAKAKGRSPVWGLAGFMGIIGLLILAILKDKSEDNWNT